MSKTKKEKFTPGPWYILPTPDSVALIRTDEPNGHYSIARVIKDPDRDNKGLSTEMGKANAHLIAAAPEMFEALDAALGLALDQLGRESTGQRDHDLVDQINGALAKARGES